MLCGNKLDIVKQIPSQRKVARETAERYAKDEGLLFQESSALEDINVTDAFEDLLQKIYDNKNKMNFQQSGVTLNTGNQTDQKNNCC